MDPISAKAKKSVREDEESIWIIKKNLKKPPNFDAFLCFSAKAPAKRIQHFAQNLSTLSSDVEFSDAKSLEHIPPSARSSDAERKLNRNLNIVKFVSTSFSIIQQRSATFNMGVQTRPTCYIQQCWKMFNKMLKAFGQGLIAFMLILNTPSRLSICVTVRYLSRSFLVNYYSNDIAGKVTKS